MMSLLDDGAKDDGELNREAIHCMERVQAKLTGRDFDHSIFERDFKANKKDTLEVEDQVSVLIEEATSVENLCQCYIGWCPFW
jgi:FKBP12-rapamycin complex-associated protein